MSVQTTWTTSSGRVITEDEAARMAAAFEADDDAIEQAVAQPVRRRGRAVLVGTRGRRSPKVEARVGEDVHLKLVQQAAREHRRMSDLVRDAVAEYVKTHH